MVPYSNRKFGKLLAAVVAYFICGNSSSGVVTQLNSPNDFVGQKTTLTFDEFPDGTPAASVYASQGVTFSSSPEIWDWAAEGHSGVTSSPPNVLVRTGFAQSIDVIFTTPVFEIGGYVGNSEEAALIWTLSALNAAGQSTGSVSIHGTVFGNDQIDQFIGLRSDVPFYKARFSLNDRGMVIDDLTFSKVPSLDGDFNGDGVVGAADYVLWRKGLGATYSQSDYDLWRTHFGRSITGSGSSIESASVPEPSTLLLLGIGAISLLGYRKAKSVGVS